MRPSVRYAFTAFTTRFEGAVPFMYCDVKGLVTTGVGNLIDPISTCYALPWRHKATGELATRAEITNAWLTTKNRQDLRLRGGMAYKNLTDLMLDQDGIDALIQGRLDLNDEILKGRFPAFEDWPADAQLALHSMAWAMGPAFRFPKFEAAVNACPPDFATAARESHMNDGAPARNAANYQLFLSASYDNDPDTVHYP